MADRHKGWRPTLRADKALYQRVQARLQAEGRTMSSAFHEWLLRMDGQTDEHPDRPPADGEQG